ncbi:MAG: DinB family protein [Chloroflexota bacterium]
MPHPLVTQLQFTRAKWQLGLEGVSAEEALKQFGQMNCISWAVGHLAYFEQRSWVQHAQGKVISEAVKACGFGQPASTPPLDEMQAAWHEITTAADDYLNTLSETDVLSHPTFKGKTSPESTGTLILRHTYHYWYHLGEAQAIRQLLGHQDLPPFVGAVPIEAHYQTSGD